MDVGLKLWDDGEGVDCGLVYVVLMLRAVDLGVRASGSCRSSPGVFLLVIASFWELAGSSCLLMHHRDNLFDHVRNTAEELFEVRYGCGCRRRGVRGCMDVRWILVTKIFCGLRVRVVLLVHNEVLVGNL